MNINFGAGTNSGTGQANIYCDILFNYKKNIGETYCLITAGNNCNIWCNMVLPNGINNFNFYSYGTRYWNGAICFPNTIRFINAYNLYGYYNLHVRFANMSDEDFANITSGLNITNLYANTLVIPNYCNRIYNR